jgi:hypothetical protein
MMEVQQTHRLVNLVLVMMMRTFSPAIDFCQVENVTFL